MRAILVVGLVAFALVGARTATTAGIEDEEAETPHALFYLHTIWYPIHKHAKAQRLGKRLKEQIAADQWGEAVKTAEALDALIPGKRPDYEAEQPWEWRVAISELCMIGGDWESALRELDAVFKWNPKKKNVRGYSSARQMAAYVMARLRAESGDFADAIKWQKAAPDEYWSGCGTCAEGEQMRNTPLLAVWKRAQLPYAEAVPALEELRTGGFTPYNAHLYPEATAKKLQDKLLQAEAALVLGELHLRQGDNAAARFELRNAAQSRLTLRYIARTRLAQFGVD